MKKITPAILALFLCAWGHLAFAQMASFFPGPGTVHTTGGGTPFSITYIGNNNNVTGAGSFTFTSQAIGTADATRLVVVGISHFIANGITVSSVTIGGISATQATGAASPTGSASSFTDIWYAAVPTGTTATIVINLSAVQSRIGIEVWSVIGTGAAFSAANNTNTTAGTSFSAAVTVPAGGGAIGMFGIHSSAPGTITGSNLTLDSNGSAGVVFGNSAMSSGSDTSHSGSTSYGFGWTPSIDAAMSVASFTP